MMSPLRERVEAPHRLELPIHPDIVAWRPLTPSDAPALGRLHAVADAVDHPGWVTPEAELYNRLSRTYVDLEHDTIAGLTRTGDIVAYGVNLVDQKPETLVRVILDGTIDPAVRGRGLGANSCSGSVAGRSSSSRHPICHCPAGFCSGSRFRTRARSHSRGSSASAPSATP